MGDNGSIIDNTPREQQREERRRHAIETVVHLHAMEILPHIANSSPTLTPDQVADRAVEICRAMDTRLRKVGIERMPQMAPDHRLVG